MKKSLIVCLAVVAASAAAAQPGGEPQRRQYHLENLDASIAEALFWELCDPGTPERCRVLGASGSTLDVMAPPEVQRQMAELIAERDALPPSYQMQVHLLAAGSERGEVPATLSAEARQALEDLSAVLGYRRFELLDSAVVETVRGARTNLAGPAGARVVVTLEVRDVSGLENEKLIVGLTAVSEGNGGTGEGRPAVPTGLLLETSVALDLGETAVVGTSRLGGGDEGLVLLLTAVR